MYKTDEDCIFIPCEENGTPMVVLNSFIRALYDQKVDIQKVAIFEEPPCATLHIGQPQAQINPSWIQKLSFAKQAENKSALLEVKVMPKDEREAFYRLKYQILLDQPDPAAP